VTQRRDVLRGKLGSPSTLIATGNNREAYARARDLFDQKILTIVDTAGIMGGETGAEVETARFLNKAREIYLAGLNKFAGDRLKVAEGEQGADPAAALETLNEVVAALQDDILSSDDRHHLQSNLDIVEKEIKSVEMRLSLYKQAQELVVAAGEPGLTADDKYLKLRQAREIYPEYPEIDTKLKAALTDISAATATDLGGEIALAKGQLKRDHFDEARRILQNARVVATNKIPEPLPGSTLEQRLEESRKLDEDIADAEAIYERLMTRLDGIRDLLEDDDLGRRPDNLNEARTRLESLPGAEADRERVVELWGQLRRLQGLDSNWAEGRRAYQDGHWSKAAEEMALVAAATNHAAKEQAAVMVYRAEAALRAQNGMEAEGERRYDDAYQAYSDAVIQFKERSIDPQTEGAQRTAAAGVERLKPYHEGDIEVERLRREAAVRLAQARALTEAQRGTPSLLQPNPGYQNAIDKLNEAARIQYTTLGPSVEADLQKVRAYWEDAYSEGMSMAGTSDDLELLQKGIALGEVLEKEKLLTKPPNRELLRRLRLKVLDSEYRRMQLNRSTPPRELEDNRRKRLSHTLEDSDDQTKIEKQLSEAVAARVLYEEGERYSSGGADAALEYLSQEMNQPEVYGSRALYQVFMQLLWEEERWDEARSEADRLRYRQLTRRDELRQLWHDLTFAAERMWANDKNAFDAQLATLNAWFLAGGDNPSADRVSSRYAYVWFTDQNERRVFLNEEIAQLKRKRVDKLVGQALGEQKDGDFLKAAQYYGYARLWEPAHPQVENGLRTVGPQLTDDLDSLLERAGDIKLQTTSFAKSIAESEDLWKQLVDIHGVGPVLGLSSTIKSELSEAADSLKTRIDGWQRVEAKLKEIDNKARAALRNPTSIRNEQGGWDLGNLSALYTNAMAEANKQSIDQAALNMIISNQRNISNKLIGAANALNKEVADFLKAVDQEDFDQVASLGKSLEKTWNDRQADGFDGLEGLIVTKTYLGTGELQTIRAHMDNAQDQKRSLGRWQVWADEALAAHETLDEAVVQLDRPLNDLRQEKSLKELKEECEKAQGLVDQFLRAAGKRPDGKPGSRKAHEQLARIPDDWEEELITADHDSPKQMILQRKREIENDIATLSGPSGPLQQLKEAMKQIENAAAKVNSGGGLFGRSRRPKGIADILFKNADKYLRECQELDPANPDVISARKRLEQLKKDHNKDV